MKQTAVELPKVGTKEFNDSAMEMFGGKPKQQTSVEFLIEQIKSKADNLPTNTKENRMAKGIYVDCLIMARQAKEMENQQGYSEEEVLNIIDNFCETFKVDLILREDFNQWFEQFKNK